MPSAKVRPYLPNSSDRLALVAVDDQRPFRAYWPLRLTQLIGGRTWSLALIRFQTPDPVPLKQGQGATEQHQPPRGSDCVEERV